ncbi:MAG TPA: divergent PAP2 family protein [Fervidobacterium sp.]|nr:divergent PAP2 family protein [Fervidobacterium sp.]HOM74036.1 divergent PAP2 family protein [Fervidobacterium sp.]HPP17759.1 divergent PAP2 family protein [Fervidobacterium sp.]HRD19507.1 divergent PAP2 family protein [Fervidobacterium sp.]
MSWIVGLLHNLAFISAVIGFLSAQVIKVIIYKDLRVFGRYGGMPSAHVATTSALAWSIGYVSGFESPMTALAAILLAITTSDAVGLRRNIDPNKGHTLMEVIYGFLLGWLVAFLVVKFVG